MEVPGYWSGSYEWEWVEVTYWSWWYWDWVTDWEWQYNWVEEWVEPTTTQGDPLISQSEYNNATEFLYNRTYSSNVVAQLAAVNTDMGEYTADWSNWQNAAPRHSRWSFLVAGVDAFLEVLEGTDQEELVSLITFNNTPYLNLNLTSTYSSIVNAVDGIVPYNGTGIGQGMGPGHADTRG